MNGPPSICLDADLARANMAAVQTYRCNIKQQPTAVPTLYLRLTTFLPETSVVMTLDTFPVRLLTSGSPNDKLLVKCLEFSFGEIMSSGSTCAVRGCSNNSRKRKEFMDGTCFQHNQPRKTCPCPAPYAFHTMPRDETKRRAWLAALKLEHPPKKVYVCSFHFFHHKPTELHPDPELFLGHEGPPLRKRRKLTACEASTSEVESQCEEPRDPLSPDYVPSWFAHTTVVEKERSMAAIRRYRRYEGNSEALTCELSATLNAKPKKKEKDCKPTEENPYLKTWLRHNYHPLQKQKRAERSHSGPMSQHFTHWNTFHPTRLHEDYCLPESVQWAKGVWKKGSCGDSESQSQPQAPDPIIKAKGKWGPLPMTHEGHRFMLTVMDYYSKWVEACPMRSDSAGEVALKVRNLVCQLGLPRALLSQMDTKFIVAVNEALGIYMAVEDCSLLAFHPDACSLDTVTHSRVNSMVSELVRDHQEHWDLHLPSALFALRLRRHPDTSHSAFYTLYRREPRKDSSPIAARELPLGLGEDHPIRKVLASRPHVDTQDRHPSRSNVDETLQDQTDVDIVLVVQCERCSLWDRVTQGSVAERGGSPLKQDEDDAYTCAACRAVTERPGEEQGEEDRKDGIPRLHVDDSLQAKQEPETWRGHDTRNSSV